MKVHQPGAMAALRLAAVVAALAAIALATPAHAQIYDLMGAHSWLPWPDVWASDHPLLPVVVGVLAGDWSKQPDWKLPMLATQFAFDAPAGIIVIEDIIMLVVRPNGTLSVSTSRAALMQDASYGVLDDDDDTIDMPIEEELLFPKRKG